MSASQPPPTLPAAPEWLAHRYDPGHDAVHLIRVGRAERAAAPFLTDDNLPQAKAPAVLRRQDAVAGIRPAPLHFIFHSAYCCSTLLANAFDRKGKASSFKEPVILNDIVGWRHQGAPPERVSAVLGDALTLLARPFAPGEAAVVKPSNVVNALAPAMLAMRPEARCVLLYAPLPQFLGSIANKGLWGRLWVRDLLAKQLRDGIVGLGMGAEDIFLQSDLQAAAVGWLAQRQLFAELAARWPDRVRTLSSETLLARPAEAMAALSRLFRVPLDEAEIETIVGEVFNRHAKFGGSFSRSDRAADQQNAASAYADELEKVGAWAEAVASSAGVPVELPAPLLPPA